MSAEASGQARRLAETREALHAVAEQVLAIARWQVTGHVGLAVVPGGFATPPFGRDGRVVAVDGTDLLVRDGGGPPTRTPLTTVRAASVAAGIEPGTPVTAYEPATRVDLDARLALDAEAARALADWYALGDAALRTVREDLTADAPASAGDPIPITLWPEHFDVAIRAGGVNVGASPGDAGIPDPYLYVGPDAVPRGEGDEFWNQPFGAARTWARVRSVPHAVAFFREGLRRAGQG
jgi:hypothetical protein